MASKDIADTETNRLIALGLSLLKDGKPADLLRAFELACPAGLMDARLHAQVAYAHAALGHVGPALAAADLAMPSVSQLWALDLVGNTYTRCHKPDRAHEAFSRAHKLAPERPGVLFNLATTAGFLGLSDEAEWAYDRIITIAPGHAEAWHNRSLLRRQTQRANHVSQLRSAIGSGAMPWQSEVFLRYALGKELEDLGDRDSAFAEIARGAALRRRHMRYAISEDVEAMERITEVHNADWCAPARGARSGGGPIFVIGMPRSGSTLLERMLGRHSHVQPLGELPYFGQALVGAFRAQFGRMPSSKSELVDCSAYLDPSMIGERYLGAVQPLRDAKPRFTDKLPMNFLYGGVIARALPDAVLIHIRRRPLDLCFAIYKTLFRDAYPFSYDLTEIGAYHRAYQALMKHWRAALGEQLIEIDYEDLVAAPRENFEVLLSRLGVASEDACLSPQDDRGGVMTASAAQVRQPIHSASVGSAERYARHLGPLRASLRL
ncbi:sulfotransferase [Novosphingobium sp. AP12]|uniref:tetratricopeptide repeat-containing sulfotransferase family protein n=1 Tax=Novosphingobium sp. AP12 TaxID=1144305 RepID=UPI000271FAF7|nr:sulfotransferase [Novosphingobium sp. AP12]EJL32980.1 hypothetical protein PMI02_01324 [Novosphingobium sp. AP12]